MTNPTPIDPELIKQLAKGAKTQEDVFGPNGIIKQLTKHLIESMMEGELTHHLGHEKHGKSTDGNYRNGHSKKAVKSDQGNIDIEVPRDRESSFEPVIIPKGERRFTGLDDKIIALYSYGMSTRDIQAQLKEMYGVELSPDFISRVTDSVMDEVRTWQGRPLEKLYPIVYLDCLVIKVQENKAIINKSAHLALAVNAQGQKELLGIWLAQNEGAKFWLNVLTELKNRGLEQVCIFCVDGLTGFPDAIEAVFPKAKVQLCLVHMVRTSMKYVSYKHRKQLAADLKAVYSANTPEEAELAFEVFAEKWDDAYPTIAKLWRAKWPQIIGFMEFPKDIRKAIYTTNAIESMNASLRKVVGPRKLFPNDDAVYKMLYLAIRNIAKKWTMPIQNWSLAMNQFIIRFDLDRV